MLEPSLPAGRDDTLSDPMYHLVTVLLIGIPNIYREHHLTRNDVVRSWRGLNLAYGSSSGGTRLLCSALDLLGSYLMTRVTSGGEQRAIRNSALLIVMLLVLWLLAWPFVTDACRGFTLPYRVGVAVLSIIPLSVLLGMPFPLAPRTVGRYGTQHVALAWAVNGIMAVVGATIATATAFLVGFHAVAGCSILGYTLLAIRMRSSLARPISTTPLEVPEVGVAVPPLSDSLS